MCCIVCVFVCVYLCMCVYVYCVCMCIVCLYVCSVLFVSCIRIACVCVRVRRGRTGPTAMSKPASSASSSAAAGPGWQAASCPPVHTAEPNTLLHFMNSLPTLSTVPPPHPVSRPVPPARAVSSRAFSSVRIDFAAGPGAGWLLHCVP